MFSPVPCLPSNLGLFSGHLLRNLFCNRPIVIFTLTVWRMCVRVLFMNAFVPLQTILMQLMHLHCYSESLYSACVVVTCIGERLVLLGTHFIAISHQPASLSTFLFSLNCLCFLRERLWTWMQEGRICSPLGTNSFWSCCWPTFWLESQLCFQTWAALLKLWSWCLLVLCPADRVPCHHSRKG